MQEIGNWRKFICLVQAKIIYLNQCRPLLLAFGYKKDEPECLKCGSPIKNQSKQPPKDFNHSKPFPVYEKKKDPSKEKKENLKRISIKTEFTPPAYEMIIKRIFKTIDLFEEMKKEGIDIKQIGHLIGYAKDQQKRWEEANRLMVKAEDRERDFGKKLRNEI